MGSFSDRDKTELNLIDYSIQKSIPILGICRGMQLIAYWAGVGIKRVAGHVNIKHMLSGQKIVKWIVIIIFQSKAVLKILVWLQKV